MLAWRNCGSCSKPGKWISFPHQRTAARILECSWPKPGPREEKLEELLDQQDELKDLEGQLQKLRQENRALAGEARLATLYRDELDALREKALRTERLQAELAALRERLPGLERCRAQLKEEREFSQALLETKAMLEGQLESAHARGQRLNQLEKEALHLQSRLNQAQEERDQLHHQAEELLRENVALERKLRRSFGESLDILRTEELECDWAPSELPEVPDALSYEAQEAGRLVALERENQELRRKLQEALENPTETRSVDAALKATLRDGEQSQVDLEAGEQASETGGGLPEALKQPGSSQEELASGTGERQALDPAAEAKVAGLEAALAEAWARLAEAEQLREAESHRASGLEDRLRGLERAQAEARQKQAHEQEQWRGEAERLADEVLALEREREALRAGSQALQAAATQAELELGEARQRLQSEQLHAAQLAQEAQRAAEDLGEARRESEALQRSLEQHKAVLARLEAEKGALEESLAQAEERQRQSDKESRRLKAQAQAQAEALADQGLCLVQLEAQLQQHQGAELSSLREATQRLGAREQEAAGREELPLTKCDAPAVLEEELQKEKEKGKEGEAALVQVKEQLLKKEKRGEADVEDRKSREEKQEGLSVGKAVLEEEHSSLGKQPEEPQALQRRSTSPPAKSGGALPLLLEALPGTQKELSSNLRANPGSEALSTRLIEVERQNAVLQAEKSALSGRVGQLESQLSSLQGALLGLQGRSSEAKEENGRWQAQNSALQVEAASLRSRQALLESQLSELRQRLVLLESEARGAQQEREQWRGRHEALLRDHDRLTVLHERQAADLEGLMGKHTSLKASLRSLEHEYRDLKGRHDQLLGEKTGLEQREEALRAQKKNLGEAELQHRQLVERHHNLEEEHERVKQKLGQMERARDDLQGELQGMRNRVTGLQLEQARLEAESATLKEQNQQLDMALGRLSTQCELLAQLKGNQEEENRHLFQETQALSRENRRLLEHSMESREQFQEEQRQYLDKLGELRREKQKLVEKIMDQYRVLEPSLPRGKKGNWLSEKFKKLMKPRRESPREQIRPMAEGAGSSESLTGQEGPRTDGSSSPAPLCKASSTVSLADAQQMHLRRCRLSSRMPAVDSPGDGEGQDTPRQRFRQRRLGMLGGSQEEAIIAAAEWEVPRQSSTSSQEERGPPLGEEEQSPKRQH
ncbi:coiled-coil domain-containing protein 88B isoform X2 [Varanus komodoensis]|uniref:coiled-coil domain-containing protein 88B isoform X2 n=1 Tax=Varanus komodoensis TaxID=61221 RepID=UPI001CF7A10D|nr:coiled-coil domain-containing protein 88B isoform X2 [Varanus komodoensis]